jgi:hypothetical protein
VTAPTIVVFITGLLQEREDHEDYCSPEEPVVPNLAVALFAVSKMPAAVVRRLGRTPHFGVAKALVERPGSGQGASDAGVASQTSRSVFPARRDRRSVEA